VKTRLRTIGSLVLGAVALLPTAGSAQSPAPIAITLIGPEGRRHDVEAAVRALQPASSRAPGLSWSARDAEVATAGPGTADEIWVDVTNPARARIVLNGGAEGPVVRTVDAVASYGDDGWPAACETVAQIVAATARALEEVRSFSPATAAGATPASPEAVVGIRRSAAPPTATVQPSSHRYGLALVAGAHTSPFKLGEPRDEANWLGGSASLSGRLETRTALFEVRLTAERSERSIDWLGLRTQYYSAGVAASRAFSSASAEFSASLGVEVGAILLRQTTSDSLVPLGGTASYNGATSYVVVGAATTWSLGAVVGLLGQATWTVRGPIFIDVVCSVPAPLMDLTENGQTSWRVRPYVRMLGGLGVRL
jgi:hypothetical protein